MVTFVDCLIFHCEISNNQIKGQLFRTQLPPSNYNVIMKTYKEIKKGGIGEYQEKNSKFLGHTFKVTTRMDVQTHLMHIKQLHPKAVHHCYAYSIGIPVQEEKSQDDGEPSGTAGRPILGQIHHHGLSNTLVIVVRYFGGVLLGTPGLIRSYKMAAIDALQNSEIIEQIVTVKFRITLPHLVLVKVLPYVKQKSIPYFLHDENEQIRLDITVPMEHQQQYHDEICCLSLGTNYYTRELCIANGIYIELIK